MIAKVTTPSGTYTVSFPGWKAFRAIARGEPFKPGDRAVTAGGRVLAITPKTFGCPFGVPIAVGTVRTTFPPGYYFRKTA